MIMICTTSTDHLYDMSPEVWRHYTTSSDELYTIALPNAG